ncbi:hypothetical protein GRI91_03625 [Altererythrobacter endophyticus]|uniref:Chemotaxis protein n=2 Tax=Altericroceibacterium endophyticum TaxID=1808508 RepID=A0A6I4T4H8_9SPHN|nr:hypothetical protein [Altericroceibacterium endophyticum]
MMHEIVDGIAPWAAFGGGAGAGFVFLKWFLEWVAGRMDRRADAIDAGTQRLIMGLESRVVALTERLDHVESELTKCHKRHAESEAEVMQLKAMLQGAGAARNHAQTIIAAERTASRKAG